MEAGDEGSEEARDQAHHSYQGVERGTRGVLEGIADRVADDGGLVGFRSGSAAVAGFHVLLGVVPQSARVRHEQGEDDAGEDRAAEETAERRRPEDETDG